MTGTYDAAERTLTNGDGVVLTNVVASGTDLTIGRQTDSDGIDGVTTLDLSGSITDADGSTYTVARLDGFAFYYCESITSVTLPAGLTSIPVYTFYECSALMSIDIPDGVTEIGDFAFYGCSALKTVDLPSGLESIGAYALHGCSALKTVDLPSGLESIGNYAFEQCASLESVTIPDGVTKIGGSAFSGCTSLTSVELPESLTSIGDFAFYDCDNLTSVYVKAATPPKDLGDLVFPGGDVFEAIYVPAQSVEAYKNARIWREYTDKIKAWPRTLTVTNGTGGGLYSPGDSVTVTANGAPEGRHFAGWVVVDGGLALTDDQAEGTGLTFAMPDADVTLEATFEDHRGGEATCVSAPICEVCGAEYGEKDPDNHSYVDGVCTRCGVAEPDAGGDTGGPSADPDDPSAGDSGDRGAAGGKDAGNRDANRADGALVQTGDASAVAGPLLAMALISFVGAVALRRDRG